MKKVAITTLGLFLIFGFYVKVEGQDSTVCSNAQNVINCVETELTNYLSGINISLSNFSYCPTSLNPMLNESFNFLATLKFEISTSSRNFLCKWLNPNKSSTFYSHMAPTLVERIENPQIRCRIPLMERSTGIWYYVDTGDIMGLGQLDICSGRDEGPYSTSTRVAARFINFKDTYEYAQYIPGAYIPSPLDFNKEIKQDIWNIKIGNASGFCYLTFFTTYNYGNTTYTTSTTLISQRFDYPSQDYFIVYKEKLNIIPSFSLLNSQNLIVNWKYFYNYNYLGSENLKEFSCNISGGSELTSAQGTESSNSQMQSSLNLHIYTTPTTPLDRSLFMNVKGTVQVSKDIRTEVYNIPTTSRYTLSLGSSVKSINVNLSPVFLRDYIYGINSWKGVCDTCQSNSNCSTTISGSQLSSKDLYCGLEFEFRGYQFYLTSKYHGLIIKEGNNEKCNPDDNVNKNDGWYYCNLPFLTTASTTLTILSKDDITNTTKYSLIGDCQNIRYTSSDCGPPLEGYRYCYKISFSKNYSCTIKEKTDTSSGTTGGSGSTGGSSSGGGGGSSQPCPTGWLRIGETCFEEGGEEQPLNLPQNSPSFPFRENPLKKILKNFVEWFKNIKVVFGIEWDIVSQDATWDQQDTTESEKVIVTLLDLEKLENGNPKVLFSTPVPINTSSVVINYDFYKDLVTTTQDGNVRYLDHLYALEFSGSINPPLRIDFYLDGNNLLETALSQMTCGAKKEHTKFDPSRPHDLTNQPYASYHKICFNNVGDVGSSLGVKFATYTNESNFPDNFKYFISFREYANILGGVTPHSEIFSPWIIHKFGSVNRDLTWGGNGIYKFGAGEDQVSPASSSIVVSFPNLCYFDENGCNGRPVTATATLSFKGYAIKDGAWKEITKGYNKEAVYQTRITYIPPAPLINLGISTTTPTTKTLLKEELRGLKSVFGNLDLLNYFIYSSPVKDNLPAAYWSYYNKPDEATTTRNPFFALNDEDLCQIELWTATGTNSLELLDGSLVDEMMEIASNTVSRKIKNEVLNKFFDKNLSLIKVIALKYLLTPTSSTLSIISTEDEEISVADFQNIFGSSTPVDGEKSLTKNFLRDIIKDKVKNMQDLRKIELRFICYQNWDGNNRKINLASNLNAGRVDGVDAVVESVSFELIPLSASIYKQSQEYSGTSGQQSQQPNQKSKTVRLKISVNNKGFKDEKVYIKFSALSIDSSSIVNIELMNRNGNVLATTKLSSTNSESENFLIGKIDDKGVFNEEVNVDLTYTRNQTIIIEIEVFIKQNSKGIEIILR